MAENCLFWHLHRWGLRRTAAQPAAKIIYTYESKIVVGILVCVHTVIPLPICRPQTHLFNLRIFNPEAMTMVQRFNPLLTRPDAGPSVVQ